MLSTIYEAGWFHNLGIGVMVWGLLYIWLGLSGGRDGRRSLIRRGVRMVDRLEGWRTFLLGLTVAGLGAAWFWDQRWLLVLSLGFGFTELHESTHVLRAWRGLGGKPVSRSVGQPVSWSVD